MGFWAKKKDLNIEVLTESFLEEVFLFATQHVCYG